ncbi:MAG: TraR/DksA C4-type zinc finger protein [Rhodospirillales bacterium]|nr:TraR/DksA C4-type zinc finger protein [Rhodospirillales bacterium]MDH3792579.1 TraR/DksA C4-type zinc finger protein [Rhodospirillales bacterium]MDH3969152.1 TraR/DksA C4-type zinc finger protein [Rhodospirillales bacterium]
MAKRSDIDLEALEARLKARRQELRRLEEVTEESRRPVELDQSRVGRLTRMEALQDQAMSLETERRRQVELQRIDGALDRIAEGDYGHCVHCGEEIAARRLEFDPAVPICIDCADD